MPAHVILPFTLNHKIIIVEAKVSKQIGNFILDTGAGINIIMESRKPLLSLPQDSIDTTSENCDLFLLPPNCNFEKIKKQPMLTNVYPPHPALASFIRHYLVCQGVLSELKNTLAAKATAALMFPFNLPD